MAISILALIIIVTLAALLSCGIGAWIGSMKGRTGLGALLGFLLGPIGWIIAAVLPDAKPNTFKASNLHASRGKLCPLCGTLTPQGNTTCTACGSRLYA